MKNVVAVIRETAEEIILPRFKALTTEQIKEKSGPGDLVTIADIEAEDKLSRAFKHLVIGSEVVGEEVTSKKPDTINLLSSEPLVWVIDPIDGTRGFMAGQTSWTILISLSEGEKLLFGIIYQPFSDEMFIGNQYSCEYLHQGKIKKIFVKKCNYCLLYTSDAADE